LVLLMYCEFDGLWWFCSYNVLWVWWFMVVFAYVLWVWWFMVLLL
jgi:hypothetical protein